jgi:hypothetical protein
MLRRSPIITVIYIVIGIFVASDHNYLNHLSDFDRIVSAVLAILLWPLVLFGANLHVHF